MRKAAERKRVEMRKRPFSAALPTSANLANHSAVLSVVF